MADLFDFLKKDTSDIGNMQLAKKAKTMSLHYKKLRESKFQYRELTKDRVTSLADLLVADGQVLQPLLVRKISGDLYEIIAGHRRYRACKYLVEESGKPEFAMIPCNVIEANDIKTEFAVFSTNYSFDKKTEAEKMDEVLGLKRLIEQYPKEFDDIAGKRIVEKVASIIGIGKSQVIDYNKIQKNLSPQAMQAFRDGHIRKSTAVELSKLESAIQDEVLHKGITAKKVKDEAQKIRIRKETKQNPHTDTINENKTESDIISGKISEIRKECVVEMKREKFAAHNCFHMLYGDFSDQIHYILEAGMLCFAWLGSKPIVCTFCSNSEHDDIAKKLAREWNLSLEITTIIAKEIQFAMQKNSWMQIPASN